MRHLFGFLCVCAVGLMPLVGCETADNGGTGGTAGGGGSAGGGGTGGGGGAVTDCNGVENNTECVHEESAGLCFGGACLVNDCSAVEDGTWCYYEDVGGVCIEEACLPRGCEGLEDLAGCWYVSMSFSEPGVCVDGACSHAAGDCTDVLDGVPCYYGDPATSGVEPGVCEGGVCEPQN